mgnify:CR=1 FL=1
MVTLIIVGTDHYRGRAAALASPKLIDVQGGQVPAVEVAPTPQEFAERLDTTFFVGHGDRDRVKQMCEHLEESNPASRSGLWAACSVKRRA